MGGQCWSPIYVELLISILYFEVVLKFGLCFTILVVNVTNDVAILHKGNARTDIHGMVEIMRANQNGGTCLLVVLSKQVLDDRLR